MKFKQRIDRFVNNWLPTVMIIGAIAIAAILGFSYEYWRCSVMFPDVNFFVCLIWK